MNVKIDENSAFYGKQSNSLVDSNHHDFWSIVDISSSCTNPSAEDKSVRKTVSLENCMETGAQDHEQSLLETRKPITKVYQRRRMGQKSTEPTGVSLIPQQFGELQEQGQDLDGHQDSGTESHHLDQILDDRPIALRKGIRDCTKHPLSKFVSYASLSPTFFAFTSSLDCEKLPKNVHEALKHPLWCTAIKDEMEALMKNQTWTLVNRQPSMKVVGCK